MTPVVLSPDLFLGEFSLHLNGFDGHSNRNWSSGSLELAGGRFAECQVVLLTKELLRSKYGLKMMCVRSCVDLRVSGGGQKVWGWGDTLSL